MNHWNTELMAEQLQAELRREMQHIRLEEQALTARSSQRIHRRNWYTRRMAALANWMIATGRDLRCRYELPDCNNDFRGALPRRT